MKVSNKMASNNRENDQVSDSILTGVLALLNRRTSGEWVGTMSELDNSLTRVLGKRVPRNWPGSPSALRVALNKAVNRLRLRVRKIAVKFGRTSDHSRTRYVKFVTN